MDYKRLAGVTISDTLMLAFRMIDRMHEQHVAYGCNADPMGSCGICDAYDEFQAGLMKLVKEKEAYEQDIDRRTEVAKAKGSWWRFW